MTPTGQRVHLEFTSAFEMLDFVQVVTEHMGRSVGLDDDARHWVSVAIRESVINAIKHGNRNDATKHVFVDLETDHMGRSVGLDDDARHWVSVAIRESVINAIKHGNRNDATKHVFVDLE